MKKISPFFLSILILLGGLAGNLLAKDLPLNHIEKLGIGITTQYCDVVCESVHVHVKNQKIELKRIDDMLGRSQVWEGIFSRTAKFTNFPEFFISTIIIRKFIGSSSGTWYRMTAKVETSVDKEAVSKMVIRVNSLEELNKIELYGRHFKWGDGRLYPILHVEPGYLKNM